MARAQRTGTAELLDHERGSDASQPLHEQVTATIRQQIASGELPLGAMLPPEIELARRLGVSRHTVRAGLDALVREGQLERRRGHGTVVVRPRIQQSLARFYSIAQEMRSRGARLTTQVLARGYLGQTDALVDEAADAFGAGRSRELGYVLRLRLVEGEPLLLETLTFPPTLCPWLLETPRTGADPAALPFYQELARRAGLTVTHAHEVFRPVAATDYEARLLGIPPSDPVFQVDRTSFAGDRVVEWRRTLARGDRYAYAVDLANPAEAGLGD